MCGIAGALAVGDGRVDPRRVAAMGRTLAHRGPDGEGYATRGWQSPIRVFRDPDQVPAEECLLAFAHRRLSILDLTDAADQPMVDGRGRALVFNGEIYNHVEIRGELAASGYRFRSTGDTEVILAAYDRWGPPCVERFNGMWAFALWDEVEKRLLCSRDRFGVKPFYYMLAGEVFYFASEIKALRAAVQAHPNREACVRFLAHDELDVGESTLIEGVRQLLPGHSLFLDPRTRQPAIRSYWELTARPRLAAIHPVEEVRALLADSVRLRLRADVPVGTCLSGGIDSSTIVALVARANPEELHTFSALFRDAGLNEEPHVRLVRARTRATGWEVRPCPEGLAGQFDRILAHQDEPGRAPGVYSQWEVMRLASGRVKVLLDGQGADEVFAGYLYFLPAHLRGLWNSGWKGRGLAAIAAPGLLPLALANRRVLAFHRPSVLLARLAGRHPSAPTPGLLRREASDGVGPTPIVEPPIRDPLSRALHLAVTRTSLPALLHYEDRASMAHSIEARTPYLDYRLVELAFSLPPLARIDGTKTKAILRRAARGLVPGPVLARRDKLGFSTPFDRWLRGPLARFATERLLAPVAADDYLDARQVERFLREHLARQANWGTLIWKIASFRSWLALVSP